MPHVGVGLGWAHMHAAHSGFFNGNVINGEADALAYQGILGVGYSIAPDVKLDLDYRFVGTDTGDFSTIPTGGRTSLSMQYYEAVLGLRWEFDHPAPAPAAYVPPPPPPAPAPVAKVPEAQRSFQVFFDFDKSDITDAAARVIQSASDSVKQGQPHPHHRDRPYGYGRLGQVQPGPVGASCRFCEAAAYHRRYRLGRDHHARRRQDRSSGPRPQTACASRRTGRAEIVLQ